MSHSTCKLLLAGIALGALTGAATPARADVTPAQAAEIEVQVRDAIGSLLGPSVKIGARPMKITADGDHYDIVVDIALDKMMRGSTTFAAPEAATPLQMTGTAKPGDNGTWTVDNVKVNSPLRFTVNIPVPNPSGEVGASSTTPVSYTVEQNGQDGHIVWDPNYQTPSTWTATTQSTTIHTAGGLAPHDTTIGPTNSVTTLRPAGEGRVDMVLNGTLQDYNIVGGQAPMPLHVAMKTLRIDSMMSSLNRADAQHFIQAATALITARPAPDSPALAPLVKAVLATLHDLASSFTFDETIDGFALQAQGQTVTMDRLRVAIDARSDQGLLQTGFNLGLEGLALPDAPLGPLAILVPQRIEIHPTIGGVAVSDLLNMANLATDSTDPTPADIDALFSHGGVTSGIESMTVEVGGATFTGQGRVVAASPSLQAVTGTAQVTAVNYDELMQKVAGIAGIGQQAMPAMVFIKGIGRNVDNKLVWDVTYKDSKVLINNVDLTAMAGGGGPAPAPRPIAPTPRQAPVGPPKQPVRPSPQAQVPSWGK